MAANTEIRRRVNDRRLYIWIAVVTPLIVLAGFARTYYLKGVFHTPPLPGRLVHLHGIVMTAWVVLFVAQISLVSARRTKRHQQLGIVGGMLAVVVVIVGVLTAIHSAARGRSAGPPPLEFLIIPLGDMLIFSVLIASALYFRRRLDIHKRLMVLAALNLLTPAIARIPLTLIQTGGPLAFFGLTDLIIVACITIDTIKHRRLHPVFFWGALFLFASQPLRLWLSQTHVWISAAESLVSLAR